MPDRQLQLFRRILTGSGVIVSFSTLVGLGVLWVFVDQAGLAPSPFSPLLPAMLNGAALLAVLGVGLLWWLRPGRRAADLTVVAVAVYVSGTVLLVLTDTPWGLYGLFGDQAFRTEAVTRFTQHVANVDYAYQGMPGHYPPLVPWLEARAANLLDRPGWHLVKVGQVVLSALAPVLSYLLWRRVATAGVAAAVVAVTTLVVADPYKIDQWLVLALLVPWWLDAFRDVRTPSARPWPAWLHGALAGVLLTAYTFYFIPLALATVLGVVVDALRGRPWLPQVLRILVITTVGLAVAAWYWLPLALARLQGRPTDAEQLRWFVPEHADALSPLEPSVGGAVMTAGVVFIIAALPYLRAAQGLALVAAAAYVVLGGGLILTSLEFPFLVFKTEEVIRYALVAAGALGVVAVAGSVDHRLADGRFANVAPRIGAGLVAVICLAGALQFVDTWTQGRPIGLAHATTLPDGSQPRYADQVDDTEFQRAGRARQQSGTSVSDITQALGITRTDDPVVVTTRTDLLATTTVHPFNTWWSIYSNPYGQFEERVQFLDELAGTSDPEEFARSTQQNGYDPIDGFVLNKRGGGWQLPVGVDDFPDGIQVRRIEFTAAQFDHPRWQVTDLGDTLVVTSLHH